MYGLIYMITNSVNEKVYIGQTVSSLTTRWANHKAHARGNYKSSCRNLVNAMRKHGIDNFNCVGIATAENKEVLDWLEDHYINLFDSIRSGYNLKSGGNSNGRPSEETRALMSASAKASGNRPPIPTEQTQAKATASRREKFAGKPRQWSVNREKPIFVDGFLYPSVKKAAEVLGAGITTLHRNVRHPATSKRKPKFECEWLCSPSDLSMSQTETL